MKIINTRNTLQKSHFAFGFVICTVTGKQYLSIYACLSISLSLSIYLAIVYGPITAGRGKKKCFPFCQALMSRSHKHTHPAAPHRWILNDPKHKQIIKSFPRPLLYRLHSANTQAKNAELLTTWTLSMKRDGREKRKR